MNAPKIGSYDRKQLKNNNKLSYLTICHVSAIKTNPYVLINKLCLIVDVQIIIDPIRDLLRFILEVEVHIDRSCDTAHNKRDPPSDQVETQHGFWW